MNLGSLVRNFFWKWLCVDSVRLVWTVMNFDCDHTLVIFWQHKNIDHSKTWTNHFPLYDSFTKKYNKCDTKYVLCNNHENTCTIMLKTLEMSVMGTYKVRKNSFAKIWPLRTTRTCLYTWCDNQHAERWHLAHLEKGTTRLRKKWNEFQILW